MFPGITLSECKEKEAMEVNFHLPGLRQNFPLNMLFLNFLETNPDFFREGVRIASFFGEFPTSLWNGGRVSNYDQCDGAFVKNVIKAVNEKGIPIRYTYTNMLLNEEDTKDPYCNFCMRAADNGMNEVLVYSPVLEGYIRKNYPGYRIDSSTCKEIRDIDRVNGELEKDYYLVVLDYNFNGRFEELEKIRDRQRCEILVNAACSPNCPRRRKHYESISKNQRILLKNRRMPQDKQIPLDSWHCEYGQYNTIYDIQDYCTYISPDEIWDKYVPMGFQNFKLEGRTGNPFNLVETYCHYMIKPEHQGKARLLLLNSLVGNKVITWNYYKPKKWIPEE